MPEEINSPRVKTIKALFALSGNQCAFPECADVIYDSIDKKVTGKVCHIKSRNAKGKRYDPEQTNEERHGFNNLILMCGKHHDIIDNDEITYTVHMLKEMKAKHEKKFLNGYEPEDSVAEKLLENSGLHQQVRDIVISVNQTGGVTAHTYVQEAPTPKLHATLNFANKPYENDLYYSQFIIQIDSPYPIGNLLLEVYASTILDMKTTPMRAGAFITGYSGRREGFCFTNIPNANDSYQITFITKQAEKFEIRYDLQ